MSSAARAGASQASVRGSSSQASGPSTARTWENRRGGAVTNPASATRASAATTAAASRTIPKLDVNALAPPASRKKWTAAATEAT